MSWIFYGAIDIGGRNPAFDDGDQASVERVMGQHHVFLGGLSLRFLQFC